MSCVDHTIIKIFFPSQLHREERNLEPKGAKLLFGYEQKSKLSSSVWDAIFRDIAGSSYFLECSSWRYCRWDWKLPKLRQMWKSYGLKVSFNRYVCLSGCRDFCRFVTILNVDPFLFNVARVQKRRGSNFMVDALHAHRVIFVVHRVILIVWCWGKCQVWHKPAGFRDAWSLSGVHFTLNTQPSSLMMNLHMHDAEYWYTWCCRPIHFQKVHQLF